MIRRDFALQNAKSAEKLLKAGDSSGAAAKLETTINMLREPEREKLDAIRINRPAWFKREDFQNWLNDRNGPNFPATWHRPQHPVGEYSDVFVVYDNGEGSDCESIPDDLWGEICKACRAEGVTHGIVWITNLQEE
jgi:hypothetical protein